MTATPPQLRWGGKSGRSIQEVRLPLREKLGHARRPRLRDVARIGLRLDGGERGPGADHAERAVDLQAVAIEAPERRQQLGAQQRTVEAIAVGEHDAYATAGLAGIDPFARREGR